jgi:hypothetical protein
MLTQTNFLCVARSCSKANVIMVDSRSGLPVV